MNFSLSLKRDDIERIKELALCAFLVCMALLLVESPAFASSGGSGGMPWEHLMLS